MKPLIEYFFGGLTLSVIPVMFPMWMFQKTTCIKTQFPTMFVGLLFSPITIPISVCIAPVTAIGMTLFGLRKELTP